MFTILFVISPPIRFGVRFLVPSVISCNTKSALCHVFLKTLLTFVIRLIMYIIQYTQLKLDLFFNLGGHSGTDLSYASFIIYSTCWCREQRAEFKFSLLIWREGGDDFLKARIATQRVPVRVELEKAITEDARDALHRRDLFDGAISLTSPSIDLCQ